MLSGVNEICEFIDPEKSYPDNGLPTAANGQRYLLVNSIPSDSSTFGIGFSANENDIIEFTGGAWTVVFDSRNTSTTEYVTNSNTSTQYRWTGAEWIDSYQGQYKNGFWKLELASS